MALVIKVGADPELFVRNKKTGSIVSAHDLMPGTKLEPHQVPKGAVQVDGVAAEFNIDPATTSVEFTTNISAVMEALQGFVGKGFELVSEPVATFSQDYFKTLPEVNRELGCNPDWNAWTGQLTEKPNGEVDFRTAAGHIHIGWGDKMDPTDSGHIEDCRIVAKNMDYYLGMYSLMWDDDTKRRSLYGKAGCFRPKPYGVEYRPLSNVWLRSERLQGWVFNATQKCVLDIITNGIRMEDSYGDAAVDIINNSVRWWEGKDKKLLDIHKIVGLGTPPPVPKPGEKEVVMDRNEAMRIIKRYTNVDSASLEGYMAAAERGSKAHIDYINSSLVGAGHEKYFV